MCTAITYTGKDVYFGRNLDYERLYDERITIIPRNYEVNYKMIPKESTHYAFIGMATVVDNYPLYYDGINECGVGMAGLNFVGNATYNAPDSSKINVAPYEFIPWILGNCKSVDGAKEYIRQMNMVNIEFNSKLPLSELHWIIVDRNKSITVECMNHKVYVYDNEIGVLTNNPPFYYHTQNLTNYMNVTANEVNNRFSDKIHLRAYSRGMGGIGLPGDLSSASRFVRAAFTKLNSVKYENEEKCVNQFFHILGAVEQQEGCVQVGNTFEKTQYSSCCNLDKGIYYYKTYHNSQITGVNLHHCNLDSNQLITYPMRKDGKIIMDN